MSAKKPKAKESKTEKAEAKNEKAVTPEVVVSAGLTIAQVQKQGVRLNVIQDPGQDIVLSESSLTLSRNLLPGDYEFQEGRTYKLVITEE